VLTANSFGPVFAEPYGQQLVHGLQVTAILTANSWVLAITLGLVLTVLRGSGIRMLEGLVAAFVAYHRNVPMLVQIFLWYFGMPQILPSAVQAWMNAHNGEIMYASVAIGLCMSAYVSEDIRSGMRAIPWGQHEASRALGLNYLQSMRHVILPQALRVAMPSLINHTVLLFKSTSLAMVIGAAEMTYVVREIENETFRTFSSYAIATAFYLLVSLTLMFIGDIVAKRTSVRTR
jgi:polar amino acid transport system permease protein